MDDKGKKSDVRKSKNDGFNVRYMKTGGLKYSGYSIFSGSK